MRGFTFDIDAMRIEYIEGTSEADCLKYLIRLDTWERITIEDDEITSHLVVPYEYLPLADQQLMPEVVLWLVRGIHGTPQKLRPQDHSTAL